MASFMDKITRFLRSPQGQRLKTKARQVANDPRKRAQAEQLLRKFRGKKH
ncbi:hypothetical protein C8D88_102596 [Lentzea atacamensis]|jgi:hypothetical protein|uniref:Uncharacterized protein n=2 Tax=Lentzea TaxID=165301 RepID=A0A316I9M7_9PSEU|nr:hypothetical protein [Lentzea atacamensis]PWK89323.1 hypothetical protein C8D88_102596 [Lentzea atacamensis]RAS60831.1 hypothetical protein C8D87_111250 [Lentzea atacamensis]